MNLLNKKCVSCHGKNIKPLEKGESLEYLKEIPGWTLDVEGPEQSRRSDSKKISREFNFKDFTEAMDFVNKVANVAEEEGHHPDIYIFYNKVRLDIWTHAVGGLTENDFILAAKINKI